jgi:hypothetical protein
MSRFIFAAILLLGATSAYAEDDLEMITPAAGVTEQSTASVADAAVLKSVAKQLAGQYRITPEKRAALAAIAAKQKQSLAPHLKALEGAAKNFANDPQLQAALQRLMKDMSGVLAAQVPQMIAAVRPMLQEALPAMLEAQAQALRTLGTPTPVDPYEGE